MATKSGCIHFNFVAVFLTMQFDFHKNDFFGAKVCLEGGNTPAYPQTVVYMLADSNPLIFAKYLRNVVSKRNAIVIYCILVMWAYFINDI